MQSKLEELSEELSEKLVKSHLRCKTISLKLRLSDFTTFTRQMTFESHTDNQQVLSDAARELLKREITSFDLVAKFPKLNLWKVGNVVKRLVIVLMMLTT